GQDVRLTATGSDPDGDILDYTWDFGDGTSATGTTAAGGGTISAAHAYMDTGTYLATLTFNDRRGEVRYVSLSVTVPEPALLRVTTNPPVPGKVIVDGVARDEWGLTWMKVAPGPHTVTFSDLSGLAPPAAQTITAVAGETSVVNGDYAVLGYLRVLTEGAPAGTIYVDGEPNNDWGMWREAAPGTYTVSFGPVAGFDPPATRQVTVVAGATATTTGVYTANPSAPGPDPNSFGYLRVTTSPAWPSTILVNGVPRDDWGLTWVKMAPGTYTVSFATVYGATPPPPTEVTVVAGQTTTYAGPFNVHGSLRIRTNPAVAATVFVDGVPRNDWGMWQSMPPGTYRVSFGALPGYVTPPIQMATVTAGETTTVAGTLSATTLDYEFYDFFDVPFGEWWDYRNQRYDESPIGAECWNATAIANGVCTPTKPDVPDIASYPYTIWTWTDHHYVINAPYRMRATGVNVPGYDLSEPVFLPVMNYGEAPGNRLDFHWYMQFLDTATARELSGRGCPVSLGGMDGYY
ncbi:MAG: PKD domain-containing protein, partial [Burkholderiales bacterium]